MKRHLPYIIILLLIGCNDFYKPSNLLERIYIKNNWEHDGILFLTESANVVKISDDSLDFYVTNDEKLLAMDSIGYLIDEDENILGNLGNIKDSNLIPTDTVYDRIITFKNYGQIFNNDKISIYTIYKSNNGSNGRCHKFYLRTYDKQHILIDTILFAVWDDDNSQYFSGELTKDLKIKRLTKDEKLISSYQILDNGIFQKD